MSFYTADKYLVGADPEVFVRNDEGKFISAHVFNCGTKRSPQKTEHGFVQVDGLALEFNINPASSCDEFVSNIKNTLGDLSLIAKTKKCEVIPIVTAHFGEKYISLLPPKCRELGCDPDYDAYTMSQNERPNGNLPFRTGAGHVHIGWREPDDMDWDHFDMCGIVARELDYYLGIPSLAWDDDKERRTMYGKAGAFRPKPYGMEYRTLSNAWLRHDRLMRIVYQQTQKACAGIRNNNLMHEKFGAAAQLAINEGAPVPENLNA